MAAAVDAQTRSRLRWSTDSKTLYWDNESLKVKDWIQFVHDLLEAAEGAMSEHLLFQTDGTIPETDLYRVKDNPSRVDEGYYFVMDLPGSVTDRQRRMLGNLKRSGKCGKLIEIVDGRMMFIKDGVDEYESWDARFRDLLSVLIILTCGQTGRGTEMLSLLYMNTTEADRNMYIEDGQLMLITEYHKSMALMDEHKVTLDLFLTNYRSLRGFYHIV
jgi:hypothetical protein